MKKRIRQKEYKDILQGILYICIALFFLLFFSYMTSPLFPWAHGWDSAFFQLVGAGMTKGYLPYRDFYDMKGPWLFLIEYLGQLMIYGRSGVFLMQCISLGITLFLCGKIQERYFGGGRWTDRLAALVPFFLLMAPTMEGGNLTEEWSLPFLFLPLYLSMDFLTGKEDEHKPCHAFGYGCCFGVLALIRITNAVMICAIVFTVALCLLCKKKWKNLAHNIVAFLLGVLISFLPPLLYFGYYGEIKNMLYCTFVFGFIYGTEGFALGTGVLFFITLLFPLVVFLRTGMENRRLWMLTVVNMLGMCVTLGMGNSTLHDYMLILPGVMLGVWRLLEAAGNRKRCMNELLLTGLLVVICFAYPGYKTLKACREVILQAEDRSVYEHVLETTACIPQEERNSVWGYEVPLRWYSISDIMPYSRYCGWQEHYMELSPEIEDEIRQMMQQAPPKWIVTKTAIEIDNEMMREMLDMDYTVYLENSDFTLYRRKKTEV